LVERGDAIAVQRPAAYVDGAAANALLVRALDVLESIERDEPWALGATSLALARALGVSEPLLMRILGAFAAQGRISHRAGYYATAGHRPRLSQGQHRLFEQIVPADDDRPLSPVVFADVASAVAASGVPGASKAFDTLLARGALVKVGNDLYREAQIAEIRAKVEAFVGQSGGMTPAQFRDLIGTSRKFAVPLLEWLDGRGFTVRDGDRRVLRR
jgi:selenocysteine-specific elongation factor